ncbi:MAG: cardiolipin synthase [Rhizobiaceae bacterium]
MTTTTVYIALHLIVVGVIILRVLLRPHREPTARIAWIAVISLLPVLGVLAYIFLGEVDIGRKHVARMRKVLATMPAIAPPKLKTANSLGSGVPQHWEHIFLLGKSISGFDPVGGNKAELMADSNAMIDRLVRDIDEAKEHVHLLFYIWLPDNNGLQIVDALKRAAGRGVKCRAMADNVGSATIVKSEHWQAMEDGGVQLAIVLPILIAFSGRIDLRNHRKIVVIDGDITYCGSQNCADAEFLPKPKYAPWVDAVLRFEGPIARQNQHLFISDWMTATDENISDLLLLPTTVQKSGFTAQVIGTGPTNRHMAMSQMFVTLITSARKELVITTPYFVPNEPIQSSLQAAAYRGVEVTIVLPAKNDSKIVQGTSRSYYQELLNAGVKIFEYRPGLLHAKTLTIDGEFSMIGSANIDRRSFDLNYENNMLIYDPKTTTDIIKRQQRYISQSGRVTQKTVDAWSMTTKLWNNTVAVLGPIL